MKYSIEYQFLSKSDLRPWNVGEIVAIHSDDQLTIILLPNVGDFVSIDNSWDHRQRASFFGKVKSKLFKYIRVNQDEILCQINIVIEEDEGINWNSLITE